jgi:ATP-dependent helicase/nuclease subunit A
LLASEAEFAWETYYQVQDACAALTPSGGPREQAKQARDTIKAAASAWLGAYLDQAAAASIQAFITLLTRFDVAYDEMKAGDGLLDFEDLLLCTHELLHLDDSSAAARLRGQFRQIMVDEFQDTNPLQFSLIQTLQGDGHLFMVGDVKQAIYRFVGSDIRVFLGQEQRILSLGATGKRIAMMTNYRTRPEVLEPLNGLFARLWPLGATDDGFTFEPLSAGTSFAAKELPSIELALWPCTEGGAAELRDREAAWIARRILQLTGTVGDSALTVTVESPDHPATPDGRPATFGDILLLFRASTDIARYEEALRTAGIPFYVVSGRGFYETREVQDMLFLLRVLDNPLDDFSLAVVLRSPLVGVSDDTLYWLSRDWSAWNGQLPYPDAVQRDAAFGRLWRAISQLESLPPIDAQDRDALHHFRQLVEDLQPELTAGQPLPLIDAILARTSYAHTLLAMDGGDQRYANLHKLREVAATFQDRGIFDLADFQRYLTQLSAQAPREASAPLDVEGSNVVRLMTIHAAKGLEAPVVFLADCGRDANPCNELFVFTPAGLACQLASPDDGWEKPANYQQAVAALTRDDRREGERLLYVALTRAREHLICSGYTKYPTPDKQTRYADILAGALGLSAPVETDTAIPITFDETSYPVLVWSHTSLQQVEALAPPLRATTLWDDYHEQILAGDALPVLTDAAEVEAFARINDRFQALPKSRREGALRIGVHRALCYHSCPRQYWFRYLVNDDGWQNAAHQPAEGQETVAADDDEAARLDGTTFGKLVHAVMQHVDFPRSLAAQVDDILATLPEELTGALTAGDRTALLACIDRLQQMPFFPALAQASALHRELRFLVREGDVFVPGIIDLLAEVQGELWILDYKTGRPSANHMRQLALYALGVMHTLDRQPARAILAYLDEDGVQQVRDEAVTPALLDEARRLVTVAGAGISAEDYHPSAGRQCQLCPYLLACPEGALLPAGIA